MTIFAQRPIMSKSFFKAAILLALFLYSVSLIAQTDPSYNKIDSFVKNFPFRPATIADIKTLAREIKNQFHTEKELTRAAFIWITDNIAYDCDGYRHNNGLYRLEDVIIARKAVCSGYASLMKLFCDEFGIECVIINGFATGIGLTEASLDSLKTNHAWNAVKINGEWKLVDATWGSGSADNDCSEAYRNRDESYFFSQPGTLINTHFPDSSRWQLLDTPITASQFVKSVKSWKTAKEVDAEKPKDSVIRKKIGETIRFLFKQRDTFNMVILSIYYKNDKPLDDIFDSVRISKSGYYYDYKVTKSGYYRVDVSLYYDKGDDKETTSTPIETYYLQISPNKKTISDLTKPQKAIKH